MTASIWKLKNIVPITKMGIEATVATASLATAITMILAITEVMALRWANIRPAANQVIKKGKEGE